MRNGPHSEPRDFVMWLRYIVPVVAAHHTVLSFRPRVRLANAEITRDQGADMAQCARGGD